MSEPSPTRVVRSAAREWPLVITDDTGAPTSVPGSTLVPDFFPAREEICRWAAAGSTFGGRFFCRPVPASWAMLCRPRRFSAPGCDTVRDAMRQSDVVDADFGPEGDRGRDAAPGSGRAPSARPQGHRPISSGRWAGAPERALPPSLTLTQMPTKLFEWSRIPRPLKSYFDAYLPLFNLNI